MLDILNTLNVFIYTFLIFAIINIVTGVFFQKKFKNTVKGYFFQMNFFWNVINLIIALYSAFQNQQIRDQAQEAIVKYFSSAKDILLVNVYLDIIYILAAFVLYFIAVKKNSVKLKGYGYAICLQGVFLFFLDLIMFRFLLSNNF